MNRLVKLALAATILWLLLWMVLSMSIPWVAARLVHRLPSRLNTPEIAFEQIEFEDLDVAPSLLRLDISRLSALFDVHPTDDRSVRSKFHAASATVRIDRPVQRRGAVVVDDFELMFDPADRPRRFPFDGFSKGYVHLHGLPLANPRQAVVEVLEGVEELFLSNDLTGAFEFSGEVLVRVDGATIPALIYTERQAEHFRLRFSRPDIEKIAAAADVELSDDQIDLVSHYPLRVPMLIQITDEARDWSQREFPQQPWLEDALRHVSWSFRLTQEFGADFSKQVTDAQEQKPGNTPNERLMDFNNNAVGRIFAEDGVPYEDLPLHVLAHDDIVRNPDEVETRDRLLR